MAESVTVNFLGRVKFKGDLISLVVEGAATIDVCGGSGTTNAFEIFDISRVRAAQ